MKLIIYILSIITCQVAFSQQVTEYKSLQSEGNMPQDFTTLSSEKYASQKNDINQNEERFDKKAKENFYLQSNFQLHDLLYSGRVLYNDKVSKYIQKVADVVLEKNPTLRKELRFYTLKSSMVNAFATDQGMLFFNLGLIAQVENEAQLAMIISHEITHYSHKHAVNRFVEKEKIIKRKGIYRGISWEDKIKNMSSYSKENEMEADLEGFKRFEKTNYSYEDAQNVFNVLKYSYLPFDDIKFKKEFFNSEHFIVPNTYFLSKTTDIGSLEKDEDDDENSTHPSISKRIDYINKKVKNKDNTNRVSFIVSETEFKEIQRIARHELCDLYLNNVQYEKALYNAYLILQTEPNDLHARKTVMKALYGMTKYQNANSFFEIHGDYTEKEGASQSLYFFTDTITSKELNVLSLNYTLRLKNEVSKDKEIELISQDLMNEMVLHHVQDIDHFYTKPQEPLTLNENDSLDTDTKEFKFDSLEYAKLSKYDKIKYNQRKQESVVDENPSFYKTAFIGLMDDNFNESFDEALKLFKEKEDEDNLTSKQLAEKRKKKRKQNKLVNRKGHAFGIDKLVIIDPSYEKIDERKRQNRKFESAEQAQSNLQKMITDNASSLGLDIIVMDDNSFQSNETQKYNDFVTLNNWLGERAIHLGNEVSMVNINQNKLLQIQENYGTKYISWLGYAGIRRKKEGAALYLCISAVYFPLLPLGIYYAATPAYDTNLYFIMFDIEKGEYVWLHTQLLDGKDSKSLVKGTLYDIMYQVKNKR